MSRVNFSDAEKAQNSNVQSIWFTLQDNNDSKKVQFPFNSFDELEYYTAHQVEVMSKQGKKYNRWVECLRSKDDPLSMCPLCNAGNQPKIPIFIPLVEYETGQVYFWTGKAKVVNELKLLMARTPNFSQTVFEIVRIGARGNIHTEYKIYPQIQLQPKDLSSIQIPKITPTCITQLTTQEMNTYLATGQLPEIQPTNEPTQPQQPQPQTTRFGTIPQAQPIPTNPQQAW